MRTVIVKNLNQPNKNTGRIYSAEVMQEAISKFKGKQVPGTIGMVKDEPVLSLPDMLSHQFINLTIENGSLIGDLVIMDNPDGLLLSENLHMVEFGIAGYIRLCSDSVTVEQFELHSINAVPVERA